MDISDVPELLFYDDDLTRHLKRTRNAAAKVALPASSTTRALRIANAVNAAGDVLSVVTERVAAQQRARRRARILKLSLVGGGAAVAAVVAQRRQAALAMREADHPGPSDPFPWRPSMSDPQRTSPDGDAKTAELLRQLSEQMSTLISQELALAKAEVTEKGKKAGIGAGMFGGAGALGFYALGALIATIIIVLNDPVGITLWLSALIVTAVLGAIAAFLALQGKKQIQQATPPAPERALASVKQDTDTIKTRAQEGRNG